MTKIKGHVSGLDYPMFDLKIVSYEQSLYYDPIDKLPKVLERIRYWDQTEEERKQGEELFEVTIRGSECYLDECSICRQPVIGKWHEHACE